MSMGSMRATIEDAISGTAAKFEVLPEHWVHGWDESLSFCFDCCEKKVAELLSAEPDEEYSVDGGWGSDGDSLAYCETCGVPLDNSFTEYACEQELEHFEEHGFDLDDPADCYSLLEVFSGLLWGEGPLAERIEKLCKKIVEELAQRGGSDETD